MGASPSISFRGKLDSWLAKELEHADFKGRFRIIIHLDTPDLSKSFYEKVMMDHEVEVRHRYILINAISARTSLRSITRLAKLDSVIKIEFDRPVVAFIDKSARIIRADRVWELGYNGSGVKVCVIDTGIYHEHPDFGDKILGEVDYTGEGIEDLNGHGTHVAGIVMGIGASSKGLYQGVAFGSSLLVAKALNNYGQGYVSDVIAAMEWAVEMGAKIVNLSLGAIGPCDGTCAACRASDAAVDRGLIVVAAAGNSGPEPRTISCPGNARRVITVGSSTNRWEGPSVRPDAVPPYSSRGPTRDGRIKPDIVAPGGDVDPSKPEGHRFDGISVVSCRRKGCLLDGYAWIVDDNYFGLSGTSMATPMVSGACALLLQAKPSLKPEEVKEILVKNAMRLTDPKTNEPYDGNVQGWGRLDVLKPIFCERS